MDINYNRPFSLNTWLSEFLPYIRNSLGLPNDDVSTVRYWEDKGLSSRKIPKDHFLKYSKAIVIGASPELIDLEWMFDYNLDHLFVCSADGSTLWLLEHDILPDLVVTDLDGVYPHDIQFLIENDVLVQVLVHGDNKKKIHRLLDHLDKSQVDELYFSTQGNPVGSWQNTLGFTDGDRAVCLTRKFISKVYLLGFNLNSDFIGKFSKPEFEIDQPITNSKRIKLKIAEHILRWVNHHHTIYTRNYQLSPGVELPFEDFLRM